MEKLLQEYAIAQCILASGALQEAAEWVRAHAKNPVVISDVNTQFAAKLFAGHKQHMFPRSPKPEMRTARDLAGLYAEHDYFIAVGSGTISDLVKYASHLAGKPYVMIATAPSMNGYFSITASLMMEDGHKESHVAHLPAALFADMDVISAAPMRLIQSGVGDSICRSTAQADWLLSHLLLGTPYNPKPFTMVAVQENYIFANAAKLKARDPAAMKDLMEWLLLGGLGMTMCEGSYPASQGEHMIAHAMEMTYGEQLPETFHGEQIAVTTLIMAELQEKILAQETLQLQTIDVPEKGLNTSKINELNRVLAKDWPEMRQKIKKVTRSRAEIAAVLEAVGAPATAENLGWKADLVSRLLPRVYATRNRFTFLDLAALTNI